MKRTAQPSRKPTVAYSRIKPNRANADLFLRLAREIARVNSHRGRTKMKNQGGLTTYFSASPPPSADSTALSPQAWEKRIQSNLDGEGPAHLYLQITPGHLQNALAPFVSKSRTPAQSETTPLLLLMDTLSVASRTSLLEVRAHQSSLPDCIRFEISLDEVNIPKSLHFVTLEIGSQRCRGFLAKGRVDFDGIPTAELTAGNDLVLEFGAIKTS